MRCINNRAEDINIAYIGGGSRGWAWAFMGDLALEESMSGTVMLYDTNFPAAKDNEIIGNRLSDNPGVRGKWVYKAVKSLKEALTGADFVVISILPGTLDAMASDVHEPERYGIKQPVGDTVGPGGLVRSLRTIPIFTGFAEAIRKYCPGAWVMNYTNPMSLCIRAMYEVFPDIRAFGCCHEVFFTQKLLCEALREIMGIEGVTREEIKTNVLGINHFTWIDRAYYRNINLMPVYRAFVDKHYEEGYEGNEKGHWINSVFGSANRVKFDLFRRYGVIAAAGDRHLAEFVPGDWYIASHEKWKFNLTPVSWRKEDQRDRIEKGNRLLSGEESFEFKPSGEEGVRQIKALIGLDEFVTNVNLPNRGQMEGIPLGSVVETNAHFSGGGIRPVMAGRLPDPVQNLVVRHVYNQETILKAAQKRDRDIALRAFVNDPLVNLSLEDARNLLDRMIRNTAAWLPGWKI
ncbi:MAG: alpha-glucosidase/alpha-galactosidase [Clostridiaceae bacterium]|jgi:alpha-galactosidase|nr:alpha-glucosidase/alpha-galactosidase [Clostridiaceae bacterium]